MKLKRDTLLSNFAFNFNLRHYMKDPKSIVRINVDTGKVTERYAGAVCQMGQPEVGAALFQALLHTAAQPAMPVSTHGFVTETTETTPIRLIPAKVLQVEARSGCECEDGPGARA